jgi:hypothetical protein
VPEVSSQEIRNWLVPGVVNASVCEAVQLEERAAEQGAEAMALKPTPLSRSRIAEPTQLAVLEQEQVYVNVRETPCCIVSDTPFV